MPVHSKITFTFSKNLLLTPQDDREVNMYVYLKYGVNWTINMGNMAILVAILFLQFESQYFKKA